jgi:hypothetical protein
MITIDVHKDLLRKHLPEYTIDGEWPIGTGTWSIVYKLCGKTVPVAIKICLRNIVIWLLPANLNIQSSFILLIYRSMVYEHIYLLYRF